MTDPPHKKLALCSNRKTHLWRAELSETGGEEKSVGVQTYHISACSKLKAYFFSFIFFSMKYRAAVYVYIHIYKPKHATN